MRPTTAADIEFVIAVEQAPENSRFILPWSPDAHRESLGSPDVYHGVVEHLEQPVGFVMAAGLRSPHRCIEFRRLVIGPKGRGYGRQAVRLLKRAAFESWNAHRLWLDVMEHNHRAIELYQSEGFVTEGKLRECLRQPDGFATLILMSLLESEWRGLRSAQE